MHFSKAIILAAASTASAAIIQVEVGKTGLAFTPNDIIAAVGDSVEFTFFPKNHSVTQSSFADPCHPLAGGFFSTFNPTTSETGANTFTVLVNSTKPIWIYCGQTTGSHCQSGMTASINAPSTGNTLAAFQALAKNATTSTSPPGGVAGGLLQANSNSSSSSDSTSSVVITTSVMSTVTAVVTTSDSTYTTTYDSSILTTYTTAASQTLAVESSTTSSALTQSTNSSAAKKGVEVGAAGVVGAAVAFALGML